MKYIFFLCLTSFLFLSCQEKALTIEPRELNVMNNEEVLSLKEKLSDVSLLKIHYGENKIFDLAEYDFEVIKHLLAKKLLFRLQLIVKDNKMYVEKLKIQTDIQMHEGDTILPEDLYDLDGMLLNKLEELNTLYCYLVKLNTTIYNKKLKNFKVKFSYFDTLNIQNEENFNFLAFEESLSDTVGAYFNLKKRDVHNLVVFHSTVLSKGKVSVKNFYYMNNFYVVEEKQKRKLVTQYKQILSTVQSDSLYMFEYDYKDMKKHNIHISNENLRLLEVGDLKEYESTFVW
jgi:hypothetical protein